MIKLTVGKEIRFTVGSILQLGDEVIRVEDRGRVFLAAVRGALDTPFSYTATVESSGTGTGVTLNGHVLLLVLFAQEAKRFTVDPLELAALHLPSNGRLIKGWDQAPGSQIGEDMHDVGHGDFLL